MVERQNRMKMTKLWPPKHWPKVAAGLILSQLVAILATFLKIESYNLLCAIGLIKLFKVICVMWHIQIGIYILGGFFNL